ncbi:MAG: tetratricopeptide repeat protein [Gemmatimonadetes bacterium]|nr:tetratricopeptide repeat protein [Gemmatimonadota bacterium]
MSKKEPVSESPPGTVTRPDAADLAVQWVTVHRRRLTIGATFVFLIGGGFWFTRAAQIRKDDFAARSLSQARFAAISGNLQLAASDLTGIITTYGRTPAGQEAVILLANVYLQQAQPQLAVAQLQQLLSVGTKPQFEGPANDMLGKAFEEAGQYDDAAVAYAAAAAATPYDMLQADLWLDEARAALAARDTARAIAAYRSIIEEDDESVAAAEAVFRLAELRTLQGG